MKAPRYCPELRRRRGRAVTGVRRQIGLIESFFAKYPEGEATSESLSLQIARCDELRRELEELRAIARECGK